MRYDINVNNSRMLLETRHDQSGRVYWAQFFTLSDETHYDSCRMSNETLFSSSRRDSAKYPVYSYRFRLPRISSQAPVSNRLIGPLGSCLHHSVVPFPRQSYYSETSRRLEAVVPDASQVPL